ncbi:MAG: sugar phosphate isomerase/epimerase [Candidatus Poribacteria bacterium]|nr:sugar phosphate isomerase/epimerase [Candidatus Poribacteria bacterium]
MNAQGVGTQLYVWSQVIAADGGKIDDRLDEVFADVAAAGIDAVEGWLSWVETPEKLAGVKQLAEKHGLAIPSLYTGGAYHSADDGAKAVARIAREAEIARELGCGMINTNPNPIGRDKTDDELKTQAANLNALGERLRSLDMALVIHNHDPEIRNDAREFRLNAEWTDPAFVSFCVDTHWIYRGGGDPVELLREVAERTLSVHLRNSTDGVWDESFGEGDIDHRAVRAVLEDARFNGWLFLELAYDKETPRTRPLRENARMGRDYIRDIFGA